MHYIYKYYEKSASNLPLDVLRQSIGPEGEYRHSVEINCFHTCKCFADIHTHSMVQHRVCRRAHDTRFLHTLCMHHAAFLCTMTICNTCCNIPIFNIELEGESDVHRNSVESCNIFAREIVRKSQKKRTTASIVNALDHGDSPLALLLPPSSSLDPALFGHSWQSPLPGQANSCIAGVGCARS